MTNDYTSGLCGPGYPSGSLIRPHVTNQRDKGVQAVRVAHPRRVHWHVIPPIVRFHRVAACVAACERRCKHHKPFPHNPRSPSIPSLFDEFWASSSYSWRPHSLALWRNALTWRDSRSKATLHNVTNLEHFPACILCTMHEMELTFCASVRCHICL